MTVLAVSGTPTHYLRPGLSFAKASSKPNAPLTISAVAEEGMFGRSPLVPGVVVLSINGQEATWMPPDDAKALVKSGESVSITVEAFIAKIVRKTRLDKLGIVLKEAKGEKGLLIEYISEESPFLETILEPGMKIVNINGARCPNHPKEAYKLMQKIFGMMKVVAVQTNRDIITVQQNDDSAVVNWSLSTGSLDFKEKAAREAQLQRKVELKKKLSKQDDKFSKGLDKLESSLTRLESSVKESMDVVRSRTENSESDLVHTDPSASGDKQVSESPSKKNTQEKSLAEGYTVRKTGSFICDIDDCDSDDLESEKNSAKRFSFQKSPAAAISTLKKLGKKKQQPGGTENDDGTATTVSTKYFNFDQSPSEAMAKLKKLRRKKPSSKRRQKKKKPKSTQSEDAKSPNGPRTVDFTGKVRKVSKKARPKLQLTISATSSYQAVADPDEQKKSSVMSRISPTKAALSRISPTKAALSRILSFGKKEKDDTELFGVVQGEEEMGMEVCIAEDRREGLESSEHLSLEGIVTIEESREGVADISEPEENLQTGEMAVDESLWPVQPVQTFDDTTLAFAGFHLVDPKRATSPRNMKNTEESDVPKAGVTKEMKTLEAIHKTRETRTNELPKEQQANMEEASVLETPFGEDESVESYFDYYSDEFETDSEYDSNEDGDYSGSDSEWSKDSPQSVAKDGTEEARDPHHLSSRSDSCEIESRMDHRGRSGLHQSKSLPMEMIGSGDEDEEEFRQVTVSITKSSRDALLGFRVIEHDDRDGIFISEIDDNSGLQHLGLRTGMRVTKVNGNECPKELSDAVSLLKNTVGAVEIEAAAGHQQKSAETALMVPTASSFIESKLSSFLSAVCMSGEDNTSPEMIVRI